MPHALIVGASRGLGRGLVVELLARGWTVTATVRRADALADLADARLGVELLDTTDWAGVDRLRERLSAVPLDLLFVNAGIMGPVHAPIGEVDPDIFIDLARTNILAPLRLVDRFADLVTERGTVAVMSSGLGSVARNDWGTREAYRTTKAALNIGLRSIAARRADGRTYLAVDPGWVRTDLGGADAPLSIEQSVPGIVDMLAARQGQGGSAFVNYRNQELPW
jgi:NAD(P)-dependent dehydrogenase (short-subunit alcohol dehydrogenase family)